MLFMVVEHFDETKRSLMAERFKRNGRMLPDDVVYVASWMTVDGTRCFRIMEAPDRAALDVWIARWSDLVRFEVSQVLTSAEYWARETGPVEAK